MPFRWCSGKTETGPRPYQFGVPSEMVTGEKAICPITRPSISATSDTVRALAARSASMMNCSVWLLISKVLNAAIVTSVIAQTSSCVSFLITIFGFRVSYSSFLQPTSAFSFGAKRRKLRRLVRRFLSCLNLCPFAQRHGKPLRHWIVMLSHNIRKLPE
jgi:hypothetical protein